MSKFLEFFWYIKNPKNVDPETIAVNSSNYRKSPKNSDTRKMCCSHPKIWTRWLCRKIMSPKDADGLANSEDPDQTAPLGAVWSGSTLFAQTYLPKNFGSLRYPKIWSRQFYHTVLMCLQKVQTDRQTLCNPWSDCSYTVCPDLSVQKQDHYGRCILASHKWG